ncbi:MAG: hypothetical protein M1828_005526 [Chrysothrix sp. TS-e1954]|nr:MAG: hypothetical protein M1828_005526 [Chrysothrix sp. TS-e1954]
MFKRIPASLPKDPTWPHNFKGLGFFIDESQRIKSIEYPTDYFRFYHNTNERWNDVHREAMHECIRHEVLARLAKLNVNPLYIPTLSTERPSTTIAHIPILTTPPAELRQKKRIIVIVNRVFEDLAIWAYRVLSREGGIDVGSAVAFIKDILARAAARQIDSSITNNDEVPGIIILNPGQLLYSYKHARAMTPVAWDALPRKSAVHPPATVHPEYNHIPGNKTVEEHIEYVLGNVIANEELVAKDAKCYLIGLGDGGQALMNVLAELWPRYQDKIAAMALTGPLPMIDEGLPRAFFKPGFKEFLAAKAKGWEVSSHPLDTPLSNPTPPEPAYKLIDASTDGTTFFMPDVAPPRKENGRIKDVVLFPLVSGGNSQYDECIMPIAGGSILDWFEEVAAKGEGYENDAMVVSDEIKAEREWPESPFGLGSETEQDSNVGFHEVQSEG